MGSNPEKSKSVAVLVLVSQNLSNFSPEWQHCYIPTNGTSKKYLTHYTTLFADMVKLDLSVMTHRDLYITCPLVIFVKDQPIWTYPALAMEKSSEMSMSKFIRTYWKLKNRQRPPASKCKVGYFPSENTIEKYPPWKTNSWKNQEIPTKKGCFPTTFFSTGDH